MDSGLTEEQALLRDSVERFVEKEYPFDRRRELAAGEEGFSRAVWARFAEFGWLAAPLPEDHGGLGGSAVEVAILMEAFGRGLVLEPYLSTVILGGGLLGLAGSEAQKATLLPAVAEGRLLLAFAQAEPQGRYNPADVETRAERRRGGYLLSGRKSVVFHAATADTLIVSARTAGASRDPAGIGLFLVDREAEGLSLRAYPTVDGLRAAELELDGVAVDGGAVVGEAEGALPLIVQVLDQAVIAVCAEAVGVMDAMVAATRTHLETREQFGVPIGSFQVLQHRVVDMFMAHELSRALVYRAAAAVAEEDAAGRAAAASAAKVQVGKAGRMIGQSAIQLHGGMGMTEELALGHHFKRLSMIATLFGDADHHLRRFAAPRGTR
jgi:alkylation response protein AidB-like acyl-CoA dehydrogenase